MKVGLVGTHTAKGEGSPSDDGLAALAGALATRVVDVTVCSCRPDGSGRDWVDAGLGYRAVFMPGPGPSDAELAPAMGDFARFLASQWVSDRPDVVNASTWIYGVAAQLAADRYGIASVHSLPQLSVVLHRRQDRRIGPVTRTRSEGLLARSATRVAVPCAEDVLDVVKLGCPRPRVSVVPQAVDLDQFSPVGPTEDRRRERRIVAVTRELLPPNGLDDLMHTISRLRPRHTRSNNRAVDDQLGASRHGPRPSARQSVASGREPLADQPRAQTRRSQRGGDS
jgi:glycosyltransferase involved in cell wall biosynthesis